MFTKTRLYVSGLQTSPLFVLDAAQGQIQQSTQYIYGPLGPLAVQVNDQQYLLIRDRENSTRMLLNSAAAEIVQAFHYKPFGDFMGELFGGSIPLMPYLYTGQEYDQLAESLYLYNFKARFYDQHLYRFYGIDPADQFFSPYLFVRTAQYWDLQQREPGPHCWPDSFLCLYSHRPTRCPGNKNSSVTNMLPMAQRSMRSIVHYEKGYAVL